MHTFRFLILDFGVIKGSFNSSFLEDAPASGRSHGIRYELIPLLYYLAGTMVSR